MADFTLAGLAAVERVAALGSITAAAEALGYTQSAMSRQVMAVENLVGMPLFARHARGVRLTAAGEVVLRHSAALSRDVESMRHDLDSLRARLEGEIVVGSFPTGQVLLVPRAIARLRQADPGIRVKVRSSGSATVLERLRSRAVDVAVVVDGDHVDHDLAGLEHEEVGGGRLRVAMATSHRLAGRESVSVEELRGEAWIAGAGAAGDPQFGAWPGLEDATIAYRVRDWPGRLGMVAAGLGLAVVPDAIVQLLSQGIHTVSVRGGAAPRRTVLAVTRAPRSPLQATFVRALHGDDP